MAQATIRIAAAIVIGQDERTLLVRKRGTRAFMQPGGKIERDEEPVTALRRELEEELGLVVPPSLPVYLGRFSALAANEPGCVVEAELFEVAGVACVAPAAEIEEVAWVERTEQVDLILAPLTRDCVLPLYRQRMPR